MKIDLSEPELTLLTSIVAAPGWAKELADIYSGGKFLANLPKQGEVEISDKTLECIKKAIKHHASQGAIPASSVFVTLIDKLNLQP